MEDNGGQYWSLDAAHNLLIKERKYGKADYFLLYRDMLKTTRLLPPIQPDEKTIDIKNLMGYIKNKKYSKEVVDDLEIHHEFMSKLASLKLAQSRDTGKKTVVRRRKKKEIKPIIHDASMDLDHIFVMEKIRSRKNSTSAGHTGADKYDHNEVLPVLIKAPHARLKSETNKLYANFRFIPAFSKLSPFVLQQICGVAHYSHYDSDRAVFLQGDVGTSWFVILKGQASVGISTTGNISDSRVVKILYAGDGFGDLALINDKPRAATILTMEPCDLVRIEKDDYNRILRSMHDREMKERITFLRRMKVFDGWNNESLKQIAGVFDVQTVVADQIIIKESENSNQFFIVQSGSCKGYRSVKVDGRTRQVLVHDFEIFDYFGEIGLVTSDQSPYKVTVKANEDTKLIVFSRFDALARFKNTFEQAKYLNWPDNILRSLYSEQIEDAIMKKERIRILDGIIRERHGNPTLKYPSIKEVPAKPKDWKY